MAKRKSRIEIEQADASFEVDLTPVLSLMVCLIPIMLLSTVFVRLTVIETPLPQVVEAAMAKDMKSKNPPVSILVKMTGKKDLKLVLRSKSGGVVNKTFKSASGEWNFAELRQALIKVKSTHPQVFKMDLEPSESIAYSEIVKVMDEVRMTKVDEPKFLVKDEKSNQEAMTSFMFPNVQLSNVVGG